MTNLTEIPMPLWEGAVFAFAAFWAECTSSPPRCFLAGLRGGGRAFRGTEVTQQGLLWFPLLCCTSPSPHAGRHAEIPGGLAKMCWWKSRGGSQFSWLVMLCMLRHKPLFEGHSAGRLQLSGKKAGICCKTFPTLCLERNA